VCGVDVSHLAFVLAYPNIRDKLRFGDLLDVDFGSERFDALIAMDVVEHLNPLKLPLYLAKIVQLVDSTGFVFINSPMIGTDDVFGTPFPPYVTGWTEAGDDSPWLRMHCDEKGWPLNGHLIWASPKWWEAQFERSGLVRSRRIERCIHSLLQSFFEQNAPARKSFFALTRRDFSPDEEAICARLRNELAPLLP
jgi:hypothetical protein